MKMKGLIIYPLLFILLILMGCEEKLTKSNDVAEPTFTPAGGLYTEPQLVTIACATADSEIRYTTDGSEPTQNSNLYTNPVPIEANTTLKAKGFKEAWTPSKTKAAVYIITGTVATPTFLPVGGTYPEPLSVEIHCTTEGASIFYTLNGAEPTQESTPFTQALFIDDDTTVKARAFKTDWITSDIATAEYLFADIVAAPTFQPPGGLYDAPQNVTISCLTTDAQIRYTLDGSNPTANSTLYSDPIPVGETTTIIARGYKAGLEPSVAVTAVYLFEESAIIFVNSIPPGASIYFNGTNMNAVTPYQIHDVASGNHHVRLYKAGYNEYNETFNFNENETHIINAVLTEPEPPLPYFFISNPANEAQFNDNVIQVNGEIQLRDLNNNFSDFTGDRAILALNGIDQIIYVNGGYFDFDVSINAGENTLQFRANSPANQTGVSEIITVWGNFSEPDIEITLTWNTPNSDVDLHIWNPLGEHCYYGNMHITEGSLDIDVTSGYGPETFSAQQALEGTYTVKVNMYSLHGDEFSDATVQLMLAGLPPATFGPRRISVADYNGEDPAAWWEVTQFTIENGRVSRTTKPIPEAIRRKIALDMQRLERK